jgi:hypothetical protein
VSTTIEVHSWSLAQVRVPQFGPTPELAPALEPLVGCPEPAALPEVGFPDVGVPEKLPAPDVPDPLESPLACPVLDDPAPEPLDAPLPAPVLDPVAPPPPSGACSPIETGLPPQPAATPTVTRQSAAVLPMQSQR